MNKFEQVSSLGHQMSLSWGAGERAKAGGGLYRLELGKGSLYGEVQCFTGNGQMPPLRTDTTENIIFPQLRAFGRKTHKIVI